MEHKRILFLIFMVILSAISFTGCIKEPTACFTVQGTHIDLGDTLFLQNCSSDAKSYTWYFGDGNTSADVSPNHIYTDIGDFTVSLTAYSEGEKKEDQVILTITVSGGACFTVSSHSVYTGDTVQFTNCSIMCETYSWNFGDSTISTDSVASHVYQVTGNYLVTLTATMLNGSVSSVSDEITVLQPPVNTFISRR